MKKIILILTLIGTMNLTANPFNNMRNNDVRVEQKASQQFVYASKAAKEGNARAQFDLALMYARGNGVVKSEKLAFSWFHKAARNNHVEAKFYMGLSFSDGRGVRKQTQLARYWFKLAAKSGHPKAMAHLASIEKTLRPQYGQNRRVAFNSHK